MAVDEVDRRFRVLSVSLACLHFQADIHGSNGNTVNCQLRY
jgi:hypothetical protein